MIQINNIISSDRVLQTNSSSCFKKESGKYFISSRLWAISDLRTGWYYSMWLRSSCGPKEVCSTKGLTLVSCSVGSASYVSVSSLSSFLLPLLVSCPYICIPGSPPLKPPLTSAPSAPPPPSVVETVQSNAQLLLDSGPPLSLRCQETISETCIPVPVLNWQEGFLKATPTTMECV